MKETFYQLPHIKLCGVEHHGNPDNQIPIIALHGWLDNANSFVPMMEFNSSCHVIAIEWPGHGFSQHRGCDAQYQLADYVYDLYALIKTNNWKKVHIIGHSLGAIVASTFAGLFPEIVHKLVLIEAIGLLTTPIDKTRSQFIKSVKSRFQAETRVPSNRVYESMNKAIDARLAVSDFNHEIASLLVSRSIQALDNGFQWRSDPKLRLLSPLRVTESQAIEILSGIECETLLIIGSEGYESVKEKLTSRTKAISTIDVKEFAGGHHVHMQQPKLVWQAVIEHFDF